MAGSEYGGAHAPPMAGEGSHHHPDQEQFMNLTPTTSRQNGAYGNQYGRQPASPALSVGDRADRDRDRDTDTESRRSGERNRSRPRANRTTSGQVRVCKKCGEALMGQFVRALDGTFHLDCFKCRVSSYPSNCLTSILRGLIADCEP